MKPEYPISMSQRVASGERSNTLSPQCAVHFRTGARTGSSPLGDEGFRPRFAISSVAFDEALGRVLARDPVFLQGQRCTEPFPVIWVC